MEVRELQETIQRYSESIFIMMTMDWESKEPKAGCLARTEAVTGSTQSSSAVDIY